MAGRLKRIHGNIMNAECALVLDQWPRRAALILDRFCIETINKILKKKLQLIINLTAVKISGL